jgi:hypothetical protein
MIFLIKLPPVLGVFIAVLLSLAFTCALFVTAHFFLRGKRSNETKTFAQQMALRIGSMHALVVALVFSILTGELMKLNNLSDAEAMSAANIYYILRDNQSEEAARLRSLIPLYLKTVIEKDWEALSEIPHDLPAWELITKMQGLTLNWKTTTSSEEMLKGYVFDNLNTMAENRNKRVIEWQAPDLPTVFWAIAFSGYILTLLPYLSVELIKRRFLLVCGYAIMIGIMFYGIAVLDKPFLSRVVKPTSFEVMYNDISGGSPSPAFEEK